jgi:hypothetical protein
MLLVLSLALLTLFFAGCDENDDFVDVTPPAIPNGVYSLTGDSVIWVIWNANREPDLAGYRVYSTTEVDGNLNPINWELLLEVGTPFPDFAVVKYDPDTAGGQPYLTFEDRTVENGFDYYYAISAFDDAGNESALSTDYVVDTPRPEGTETLSAASVDSSGAGFDFSDEIRRYPADLLSDFSFDFVNGIPTFTAQIPWVRMQDYGNVSFDTASYAPEFGWSQTGIMEAIEGHSYFLEIVDGDQLNYAKLHVLSISPSNGTIRLMWGYQPVNGLPELKQPREALPPRGTGKEGSS